MAKTEKKTEKKREAGDDWFKQEGNSQRDPDAGFVKEGGLFGAPFWKVEEGARIKGKLLGAYTMPNQYANNAPKDIVQVQTLEPTSVGVKGEDETEEVPAGTVVSVNVTNRLELLVTKHAPLVEAGAEVHVLLTVPSGRIRTRSGFNVWPIEIATKMVKAPVRPVIPRALASKGGAPGNSRSPQAPGEDEVPY